MRWLVLLVLSGCNSLLGVHDFTTAADDAPEADAALASDGLPDDAMICIGAPTGLGPFCQAIPADSTVSLPAVFMTDACSSGSVRVIRGATVCVVVATQIDISNVVRVTGAYPLALVAEQTIAVTGTIDIASLPGSPGAGTGTCAGGTGTAVAATGTGGSGGSFGGAGGRGGGAAAGNIPGGSANAVQPLDALRLQGGCRGGDGGVVETPAPSGGAGGGAIYLAAGGSIAIAGSISAGGAGGAAGGKSSGGGGGGSGGLIGLDAPMIMMAQGALVVANGGGGAGGAQSMGGHAGADAGGASAAPGGTGNNGGTGGAGSFTTASGAGGGNTSAQGAGAGGGGGGAGIVFVDGTLAIGGTVSPPPSMH